MTEEIRTRAVVENISEKVREARPRWLGHVKRKAEKDVAMRTYKMEVSGKDWNTKTEVGRCHTNTHEGERSKERGSTRPENVDNENLMRRVQNREKAGEEKEAFNKAGSVCTATNLGEVCAEELVDVLIVQRLSLVQ